MPIDDDNNLIHQGSRSMNVAAAIDQLTPPQYGDHQFDRLYSDIDPTGYMTPAGGPSGMNTPFQSRSRSVSTENLTSLNGVASSDLAANALQSRLSTLDVPGPSRVTRECALDRSQFSSSGDAQAEHGNEFRAPLPNAVSCGVSSGCPGVDGSQHSSTNGDTVSRRESEEDDTASGSVTPQHIEYSAESLAKVPSYKAALQSQTRTPVDDGLPTYQSATSISDQVDVAPRRPCQVRVQLPLEPHRDLLRRCA